MKVTVTFRGREMAHQEFGHQMLQQVIANLADIATPESIPKSEGRTLVMIMLPKPAEGRHGSGPDRSRRPGERDRRPRPRASPKAKPVDRHPGRGRGSLNEETTCRR